MHQELGTGRSESKCCCSVEVARVLAWWRLLEKFPAEEMEVSGRTREMSREISLKDNSGLKSYESSLAKISRTNQNSGEVINPIPNGTTPVEGHFWRDRRFRIQPKTNGRGQVGQVRWAKECGKAGVSWVRKQWIEGVEILAVRIGVAARKIETHSNAGLKSKFSESYTVVAGNGASQNAAVGEAARLKDSLRIIVENFTPFPDAAANRFANLLACLSIEGVQLALESKVVA